MFWFLVHCRTEATRVSIRSAAAGPLHAWAWRSRQTARRQTAGGIAPLGEETRVARGLYSLWPQFMEEKALARPGLHLLGASGSHGLQSPVAAMPYISSE